jgi:hypothetical protein
LFQDVIITCRRILYRTYIAHLGFQISSHPSWMCLQTQRSDTPDYFLMFLSLFQMLALNCQGLENIL